MERLAASVPAGQLAARCYGLYEALRPDWRGWGVKGELGLERILQMARGGGSEA